MRDDYKINGATAKLSIEVDKDVADKLAAMERFKGIKVSELANVALKRFITQHSDFLPLPGQLDAPKK
jgi:hypothetical protein